MEPPFGVAFLWVDMVLRAAGKNFFCIFFAHPLIFMDLQRIFAAKIKKTTTKTLNL